MTSDNNLDLCLYGTAIHHTRPMSKMAANGFTKTHNKCGTRVVTSCIVQPGTSPGLPSSQSSKCARSAPPHALLPTARQRNTR